MLYGFILGEDSPRQSRAARRRPLRQARRLAATLCWVRKLGLCVKLQLNKKGALIMAGLAEKECVPCKGWVAPLKGQNLTQLSGELKEGWRVANEHHLEKEFKFKDFREALAFTNKVGELAEAQGHHPDIYLAWGKVKVTIWTHKIDGLTESDFVLAAKIDRL